MYDKLSCGKTSQEKKNVSTSCIYIDDLVCDRGRV